MTDTALQMCYMQKIHLVNKLIDLTLLLSAWH